MAMSKNRNHPKVSLSESYDVVSMKLEESLKKESSDFDESIWGSENMESDSKYWNSVSCEPKSKSEISVQNLKNENELMLLSKVEKIKQETRSMFSSSKVSSVSENLRKKSMKSLKVGRTINELKFDLNIPHAPTFIDDENLNQEKFFAELKTFYCLVEEFSSNNLCKDVDLVEVDYFNSFSQYSFNEKLRKKIAYFSGHNFLVYFDVSTVSGQEDFNKFIWGTFKELIKIVNLGNNSTSILLLGECVRSFVPNVGTVFDVALRNFAEKYIEVLSTHSLEFVVEQAGLWHKSSKIMNFMKMNFTESEIFAEIVKEVSETSADILFSKSALEFGGFRSPWNLGLRGLSRLFCMIDFSRINHPDKIVSENIFGRAVMLDNLFNVNDFEDVCRMYRATRDALTKEENETFIKNLRKSRVFTSIDIEDLVSTSSYAFDSLFEVAWSYDDMDNIWRLFFKYVVKYDDATIKMHKYSKKERFVSLLNSFWMAPAWNNSKSLRIPSEYTFNAYGENVLVFMLDWLAKKEDVTSQQLNVLFRLCEDNDYLLSNISTTFNENIVSRISHLPSKMRNTVYMNDNIEKIAFKKLSWIDKLRGVQAKLAETKAGLMTVPEKKGEKIDVAGDLMKSVVSQDIKSLTCGWKFVADGISPRNVALIDEFSSAVLSAREFVSMYPSLNDDTDFINSRIEVYWVDVVSTFHRERNRLESVRRFSTIKVDMNPNDTLEQNISVLMAELQAMVDGMALRVANDSSFELQKMQLYMNERFPRGVQSCKL